MTMKKIITYCALALILSGCHKGPKAPTNVGDIGPGQPINEVFALLENTYSEWEDVQMPVALSMSVPEKLSISGRATMVRDSAIYLSLRMMGMEVAQAYANPDSVWVVDKYHKKYLQESLSTLCGSYQMALDDIQDCLLGQAFPIDDSGVTGEYKLDVEVPWLTGLYFVRMDPPRAVAFSYAEMQETPAGLATDLVNISARMDSLSMSALIQWNFDKAQWNTGRTVEFKRPGEQYKRVALEGLLRAVKL